MTSLRGALGALSSHRFLMRAAFAAGNAFAWVFVLQYFYLRNHQIDEAFVQTILLYALSQVITALATPYAAVRIAAGTRRLMIFGIVFAAVAFCLLGTTLSGLVMGSIGLVGFAISIGLYRAVYWVPYVLERESSVMRGGLPQEALIAIMPAIVGFALFDGALAALSILVATAIILIASIAPLLSVPDYHERFSWSYRDTFGELFEPKYNPLVESAFLEGLQGTALLLLWPLSVFLIVGSSYRMLGLVLAASLLFAIPLRAFGARLVKGRLLLEATLAASAWIMRLTVATPFGVVLVNAYSFAGRTPIGVDVYALEQAADNTSFVDELTALKEIALCIGRLCMCAVAAVCITFISLPAGIAISFLIAAAASAIAVVQSKRRVDF